MPLRQRFRRRANQIASQDPFMSLLSCISISEKKKTSALQKTGETEAQDRNPRSASTERLALALPERRRGIVPATRAHMLAAQLQPAIVAIEADERSEGPRIVAGDIGLEAGEVEPGHHTPIGHSAVQGLPKSGREGHQGQDLHPGHGYSLLGAVALDARPGLVVVVRQEVEADHAHRACGPLRLLAVRRPHTEAILAQLEVGPEPRDAVALPADLPVETHCGLERLEVGHRHHEGEVTGGQTWHCERVEVLGLEAVFAHKQTASVRDHVRGRRHEPREVIAHGHDLLDASVDRKLRDSTEIGRVVVDSLGHYVGLIADRGPKALRGSVDDTCGDFRPLGHVIPPCR